MCYSTKGSMEATRLQLLEEASWNDESKRKLYSTPLFPGFPWYTATSPPKEREQPTRRFVVPYFFTFRVFVKGRWVGRELVDVYSEEHVHHSRSYYEACVEKGRLQKISRSRCNVRRNHMKRSHTAGEPSGADASAEDSSNANGPLQHGDVVLHSVHRHEIPVRMGATGVEPIVLAAVRICEYGILVVHKPAGLPTHASGRYFMNSCTAMLEYVLAPRRLHAWLVEKDPLLQSLVSTIHLTGRERDELLAYYLTDSMEEDTVPIERLPRPCHRLDKVTSGVLLLGISKVAARRVGEALMSKTRQMEEILPRRSRFESDEGTITFDKLHMSGATVRKRYLARVRGCFPENSMKIRFENCPGDKNKEGALADSNEKDTTCPINGGLLIVTKNSHEGRRDATDGMNVKTFVNSVGVPVLFTSPLRQYRFSENETIYEDLNESYGTPIKEMFCQDAMTLCQPLRHYQSDHSHHKDAGTNTESLVHCVPFSGRMHQIRIHLSDWGHPIVGDVTYNTNERGHDRQTFYFCVDELPKSFRDRFYASDELCWECGGKLPVASFDGSNGSRVALHAWRYEMEHKSLLACSDVVDSESITEGQILGYGEGPPPSLECCYEDAVRMDVGFVQRQGPVVIFLAPPPPWVVE
ncbi:hypothetical protein, conserved [Trypanosoma brucei gambiense DAL972]|uniref:Pseudouridine synthase RsuA/RluA-like domain-containing protein n=1 Tax=Trypanosoma brucei gambiense (strain MHOM/CI/86/DAL972) TaxID=679716 RepID=C9ZRV9_TRYB9|nr:hypothetical protein, conserved [Trypanosoma brucei gambiense DAL972]CBH12095.1 hypothetical protein, conserved [Trypanosoma brucei gambiense DAL972]|eukprot:XP_011774378.1 hypothetical protein, conserved [Trypanosoma brucei gambiense DAL972]